MSENPAVIIDVRLSRDWAEGEMREDIRRALTNSPTVLPPKWLYDDRGSELFDQITRLDEYYPTEAERSLLTAAADEIASLTKADTVVELGSGTSDKTRTLLDGFYRAGVLRRFVPLDVSEATLIDAATKLAGSRCAPWLAISPATSVTCRQVGVAWLPFSEARSATSTSRSATPFSAPCPTASSPTIGCCSGSTWSSRSGGSSTPTTIPRWWTREFIKNVVVVLNESLGANFDVEAYDYAPMWDGLEERVDMRLRATMPQRVRIESLGLDLELGEGEELRVEV